MAADPTGVTCQALSCTETVMTGGVIASPDLAAGVGDSTWTFTADWQETLDGETTTRSASSQ